jgi:hypothetical protein
LKSKNIVGMEMDNIVSKIRLFVNNILLYFKDQDDFKKVEQEINKFKKASAMKVNKGKSLIIFCEKSFSVE